MQQADTDRRHFGQCLLHLVTDEVETALAGGEGESVALPHEKPCLSMIQYMLNMTSQNAKGQPLRAGLFAACRAGLLHGEGESQRCTAINRQW